MRNLAALLLVAACAQPRASQDLSSVQGVWESPDGFTETRMDIQADGQVVWYSAGCLDESHARRRATYAAGKLKLSEPVQEYVDERRLVFQYFLDGGREYFVPQESLDRLQEDTEPFGDVWLGLRRRQSKAVLQERFAATKDADARREILNEWGNWPMDRAGVDYLERVLRDDPSERIRLDAVISLKWAGRLEWAVLGELPEVVDPALVAAAQSVLTRVASQDPSEWVRKEAGSPPE